MTASGNGDGPGPSPGPGPLLDVRDLRVSFATGRKSTVVPIESVTFSIEPGERVALVGESGSGKSLTALTVMGMAGQLGAKVAPESRAMFRGEDLLALREQEMRRLRGGQLGMIFQDPLASLNPVYTIGRQVTEALQIHRPELSRRERTDEAIALLRQVGLPRPEHLVADYPHQLSGGMRQRVMIAMALAGDPNLLIADEPTTALDVTVQSTVLDLLHELSETRELAVLLITHDLSVVAGLAERVLVMYAGRIVEQAPTGDLYREPWHPYTISLLRSIPPIDRRPLRLAAIPGSPPDAAARPSGCAFHPRCFTADGVRCETEVPSLAPVTSAAPVAHAVRAVACHACERGAPVLPRVVLEGGVEDNGAHADARLPETSPVLLAATGVSKRYRVKRNGTGNEVFIALRDVSLTIARGEALGIVGESGSGKSTLARCLLRLQEPSEGDIAFDGEDIGALSGRRLRGFRMHAQMIFQDPSSSLDPKHRVRRLLAEPLRIHGLWGKKGNDEARLRELLELVSLPADALDQYPRQFSGGQLQRIAIARALVLRPKLLVCDEPVSSLDISVRSSILNLLNEIRRTFDIALLFIAHDLALVRYLCDRIGVMYAGELVELKPTQELFASPEHAHTRELLGAQPTPDPATERRRRDERREIVNARPRG